MLRLLLCKLELRSCNRRAWDGCTAARPSTQERRKGPDINSSSVQHTLCKSKSPRMRRNLRFPGAVLWVLIPLMPCSSRETALCRELMDMLDPQGGTASTQMSCMTTLRGREGSLQSGQNWAALDKVQAPALLHLHFCAWERPQRT